MEVVKSQLVRYDELAMLLTWKISYNRFFLLSSVTLFELRVYINCRCTSFLINVIILSAISFLGLSKLGSVLASLLLLLSEIMC